VQVSLGYGGTRPVGVPASVLALIRTGPVLDPAAAALLAPPPTVAPPPGAGGQPAPALSRSG
jgi:hypothetical protein